MIYNVILQFFCAHSVGGVSLWSSRMIHDIYAMSCYKFFYVHRYSVHLIIYCVCCSRKHKPDGDWKGNATRLKTCNPHSGHLVVNSDGPQQIEANKEIIFTYDVNFEVVSIVRLVELFLYNQPCY